MIRKDKSQTRVSYHEAAQNLNRALEAADPLRLEGLTQLQRVRAIKAASLERERARLAAKYGETHARVVAIDARRKLNAALLRDVEIGVGRARTPAVQPDPNAWTVHGYVRNRDGKGLAKLTVSFVDEQGRRIEEGGYACTDAGGYFRLTVKSPRGAKMPIDTMQKKQAVEEAEAAPAPEAAAAQDQVYLKRENIGGASRAVYLGVGGRDGRIVHVDDHALVPALGTVMFREIVLGDDCGCTPPGDEEPGTEGRYLGNRKTYELHDLNNVKSRCQIDEIKDRQYFSTQKEARAAGYDFCAYCFGKDKSKR